MMKSMMIAAVLTALAAAPAMAQKGPIAVSPQDAENSAKMHAMIDANHDRRVTRQEMQLFGIQNRLGVLVNAKTWKKADVDGNGSLSVGELTQYLAKVRAARQTSTVRPGH